jgi:septal ring factor EnvC (AmiA/AmiB activator)
MQTRELPIKITDAERDQKARQAADKRHEITKLEAEIKVFVDPKKKRARELEAEADALEEAAATGELQAQVAVEEVKDFERNEIRVVRKDTGETIEGPRAMTGKERQTMMVTDPVPPAPPAEPAPLIDTAPAGAGPSKRRIKLPKPGSENN